MGDQSFELGHFAASPRAFCSLFGQPPGWEPQPRPVRLRWPHNKDAILESLFDRQGVGDAAWRTELSRAADRKLRELVVQSAGAVVVSWWKHPQIDGASGTDTAWLSSLSGVVVELHCECAAEVAADRFFGRSRHVGHLDDLKSRGDELSKFRRVAALGPLGVGPLVVCNTEVKVDVRAITRALNERAG